MKVGFVIPTIREPSLYGPAIESIKKNKMDYDVHLAINVPEDKKEGNIYYHADKKMNGAISALNATVAKIRYDYDYFITFTDETRLLNDWEPIFEIIESTKNKIVSLSAEHPVYLPRYGEPDSPPYDYGLIQTLRFPALHTSFLDRSEGVMFNECFKYAASDLWLSYWMIMTGDVCIETENIKLLTISSKPEDTPQKIQTRHGDLYIFFDLVRKHMLTQKLTYNMDTVI